MANSDRPSGFRPKERVLREGIYVAGGTIYPGDAVTMNNAGKVVVATASQTLLGISAQYAVADDNVKVWDHPDQKFVVQADDGTTLAQTSVGLNFNIVATSGNTAYRRSRMELDSSTGATNSTLPLRLLGASTVEGNTIGEFAECVVVINNHQVRPGSEGL